MDFEFVFGLADEKAIISVAIRFQSVYIFYFYWYYPRLLDVARKHRKLSSRIDKFDHEIRRLRIEGNK